FQNERFVFGNVHHAFKIAVLCVSKGGHTDAVQTRSRLGPGDSPEREELVDDLLGKRPLLTVAPRPLGQPSPHNRAAPESRNSRDLDVLEKIYANSVLFGDKGPDGWGITYATQFHMANDSKLFPPRPHWEAQGYRPDEYGRWIKFRESQPIVQHPNEVG